MSRHTTRPRVIILHPPTPPDAGRLTRHLDGARLALAGVHAHTFRRAGADLAMVGVDVDGTFGSSVAELARDWQAGDGVVLLSHGALPLLRRRDARRLVRVARSGAPVVLTNNRFSSDVCAVGDVGVLRHLPPLAADNGVPRWLEAHRGVRVRELGARRRLGIDLDTPLDLALMRHLAVLPGPLQDWADDAALDLPRLAELRAILTDRSAELLVVGRTSAGTLRWMERHTRCRVRAWIEERGMRAASATERPGPHGRTPRPPASILAALLEHEGPESLGAVVERFADGAVIDTRVLLAAHLGRDERSWPSAEDRFASDLLLADQVRDPWLAALTRSAAAAPIPILLGAHTLVGPGLPLLAAPRECPRWARGHRVAR